MKLLLLLGSFATVISCKASIGLEQGGVSAKATAGGETEGSTPEAGAPSTSSGAGTLSPLLTIETPAALEAGRDFLVRWNALPGSSGYSLKVASDPACRTPVFEFILDPEQTSQTMSLPRGQFYVCLSALTGPVADMTTLAEASAQIRLDPPAGPGPDDLANTLTPAATAAIAFSAATSSAGEGAGTATLTVTLSAVSAQDVTAAYAVTGGTAQGSSTDYTLATGTVTILAGQVSGSIAVTLVDDALIEANETVVVALSSPTSSMLGTIAAHTLTITDNDFPTLAFAAATSSVGEGTASTVITATLSSTALQTITVEYAVSGGTATGSGSDYTLTSGTLTFAPGEISQDVTVAVANDATDEVDETVIITISNPAKATLGGSTEHTVLILDNDGPTVAFAAAAASAGEAAGTASLNVALSAISPQDITVAYSVTGGTALGSGADFTLTPGTLTILAGQASGNLTVALINDTTNETDETVVIELASPSNSTLGAVTSHSLTISDNDFPTVAFASAASSIGEGTATKTVTATLSATSLQTVTVDYAVTGGTAIGGGTDFTLASGTLTYSPGETSKDVTVAVVNDATDEVDETIIITLSNATRATLGGTTGHTLTLTDNDGPTVTFAAATSSAGEASGTASLNVALSAISPQDITVAYSVTGGTALGAGTDFTLASGTLTILAGQASENITVTLINDAANEADETVVVGLSGPSNSTMGATPSHTLTISDNDFPTVTFASTTSNVGEGTATKTVTATLSSTSLQAITVDYAVTGGTATGGGTDYTLASGTLTYAPGDASKDVTVAIANDATDEVNETIVITLSNPTKATLGGTTGHTLTITDNDGPTVAFSAASSSADENSGDVNLAVTLSATSVQDITVDYAVTGGTATSNADYTLTAGTLTFTAGQSSKNIVLVVTADAVLEANETVIVTISSPTNASLGGTTARTHTISNDDGYVLAKSIGAAASRAFATMEAWEDARDGGLTTRQVFTTTAQAGGAFTHGSTVTGGTSGATGTYVKERETPTSAETQMSLDAVSGTFQAAETLSSGAVSATLSAIVTTSGTIERGELYNDGVFTADFDIDGSTTDSGHYIHLVAAEGHGHTGIANSGVTINATAAWAVLVINDPYTILEDLDFIGVGNINGTIVEVQTGIVGVTLRSLILRRDPDAADTVGAVYVLNGGSATIENSIAYGFTWYGFGTYGCTGSSTVLNIYNSVVIATLAGIRNTDCNGAATITVKNSIANGFGGTMAGSSRNNISLDASAPGTGSIINAVAADLFVSVTPGAENLHLKSTSAALDTGTSLASLFTTDMFDLTRAQGPSWDIGAFERPAEIFTDNDATNGEFDAGTTSNIAWNGTGLALKTWTETERELSPSDTNFDVTGLVGLWHLNEANASNGSAITDASASNNSGTLVTNNGATVKSTTGQLNGDMSFDGNGDSVVTTATGIPANNASQTVMLWFKYSVAQPDGAGATLISLHADNSSDLSIGITSGVDYLYAWRFGGVTLLAPFIVPSLNVWHHLAYTFNGTTHRFYLDSLEIASSTVAPNTGVPSSVIIGSDFYGDFFNGKIDEVAIFNRPLSATEIALAHKRALHQYGGGLAGTFTSQVFEASAAANWPALDLTPKAPTTKELPAFGDESLAYADGGVSTNSLKALWHFNGTGSLANGAVVLDATSNVHHGAANGGGSLAYATAKLNQGVVFDANNDYISMTDHADFTLTATGTYSWVFWAKPSAFTAWSNVWSQANASSYFMIYTNTYTAGADWGPVTEGVSAGWISGGSGDSTIRHTTGGLTTTQWHHVAVTYDGSLSQVNRIKIYVDGVDLTDTSDPFTSGTVADINPTNVRLGNSSLYPAELYSGALDEFSYWHRVLTAAEILALYKRGTLNIKYQVRACNDNACSGESFVGPANDTSAYFTELTNPSHLLPFFPLPSLSDQQYFQYKVIMTTDTPLYTPELRQVQVWGAAE